LDFFCNLFPFFLSFFEFCSPVVIDKILLYVVPNFTCFINMKLLIVEPEGTGHHMALYVRLLVRSAVKRGWEIHLLTTAMAIRHPAFKLVQSECKQLVIHLMPNFELAHNRSWPGLLLDQFRCYMAILLGFKDIIPSEAPDFIYIVNIDHIDKIMAILGTPFGKFKFSGMMMNIKFHRNQMQIGSSSRSDWLYEKLFLKVLKIKTLKYLTVIDEPFSHYARRSEEPGYGKLILVPDVGDLHGNISVMNARTFLGIPDNSFAILVYGALTPKKGVEQLLQAVSAFDLSDVVVVLAGVQDDRIRELLSEPLAMDLITTGHLLVFQGFHNEVQEYRVFRAANAVWVGYIGNSFGSSGVLYQSCSIGVPVLATSNGLVGWLVKQHKVGLTFDPTVVEDVAKSITLLLNDPNLMGVLSENAEVLAMSHTAIKFGDAICDAIQQE
jgi:glycosyltransferase involved in cell wall biosynthesis